MEFLKKLFKGNKNTLESEPEKEQGQEDVELLQYLSHPVLIPSPLPSSDYLILLGKLLFGKFFSANMLEDQKDTLKIAIDEPERKRLDWSYFTLWLFDFQVTNSWGETGEQVFLQQAKLPRKYTPKTNRKVGGFTMQTIREFIYSRGVLEVKLDTEERKKVGYYFGILEFPGQPVDEYTKDVLKKDVQYKEIAIFNAPELIEKESEKEDDAHFDNPNQIGYNIVKLEGNTVEELAYELHKDALPKIYIDQIDISSEEGLAQLLACLMLRKSQTTLEKDEIMRFVENNRQALESGRLDTADQLFGLIRQQKEAEGLSVMYDYFKENTLKALNGQPEKINMLSDKLFWLIYALSVKLLSKSITYREALHILNKEENKNRISNSAILYMTKDCIDQIGTKNEVDKEMGMMILESALIIKAPIAVQVASILVTSDDKLPVNMDTLLDLLNRCKSFLEMHNQNTEKIAEYLTKLTTRFRSEIEDDDL